MANQRIVLTLAGVFLAGIGTGMLGMRYGLHDQIHRVAEQPAAPPSQDAVLARFKTELDLNPEQAQKLAAVLADYQHYYQAVQDQIEEMRLRDQIDDLRATGKSKILEILNPDQREKFEKMTHQGTGLDPEASGKPQ
jgi:Spy/CpxP family protein refolding chaperone